MILLLGLARESRISPETTRFVGVSSSQATVLTGKHLPPRKKGSLVHGIFPRMGSFCVRSTFPLIVLCIRLCFPLFLFICKRADTTQ